MIRMGSSSWGYDHLSSWGDGEIIILKKEDRDLDEVDYANYLEAEILEIDGEIIRASWQSGVGAVLLGFIIYATNAIESSWRVLKGLFDRGFRYQNVAQLIIKITKAISSRMQQGKYVDLQNFIENPPAWLLDHAGTRRDGDDERRIDGKAILAHYNAHHASGTFLEQHAILNSLLVFEQSRFRRNC